MQNRYFHVIRPNEQKVYIMSATKGILSLGLMNKLIAVNNLKLRSS